MNDFQLIATWRIAAPQQEVFDAVSDSLRWPAWWPGAESVEEFAQSDENGIGGVRRYVWKGRLPYRLAFDACTTRVIVPSLLEATVSGDLAGIGRWSFSHVDGITTIHYEWHVRTTKRWMNLSAPLIRTFFANNHHALMKRGATALAHRLGARLVAVEHRELSRTPHARVNRRAACGAGFIAGIVATGVQMILWWSASQPPIAMLLRDSRLAAAIVLGRAVLPPPVTFDWQVMLAATFIHFTLSVVYGLAMTAVIARLPRLTGVLAGGLLGLALYGLNMHGFTAVFPWFETSRDWITAVAHVSFGVSVAAIYHAWQRRLPDIGK